MHTSADVKDAASRLAEFADEAARFFHQLDPSKKDVTKRPEQLESLSRLANEFKLAPSTDRSDTEKELEFTTQILLHCSEIIRDILSELNWREPTLTRPESLTVYEIINRKRARDLFDDLKQEQLCLVAFRNSEFKSLSCVSNSSHQPEYSNSFEEREKELLHYLFVIDPRQDRASLEAAKGHVLEGTCTWITEIPDFRYWLLPPSKCKGLVIQGSQGTGKTMLASYIAGQLERLSGHTPDNTVLYFFCSQGNIYKNSTAAVLRGLIWQLCKLRPKLIRHGLQEVRAHGSDRIALAKNVVGTLWQIFVAMIRDPLAGNLTCILDGIDECDVTSIKSLIERLSELITSPKCPQNFRLLMTCLSVPPQMKHQDTISILSLDSELHESNARDVQLYIKTNVKKIAQDNGWSLQLHDQVVTALASRPNQSFHWASLVLSDLQHKSQLQIPLHIRCLSNSFETVYGNILQEIPTEHIKRLRLLFSWLLLVYHPLTIEELDALMGDQSSDPETSIGDLQACLKVSRSLLIIRPEIRKSGLGYETMQTVQFSQRSVRDFFHRYMTAERAGPGTFQILSDKDHESIASRCLDLMGELLPAWSEGNTDKRFGLVLPYATRYWFRHLGECPQLLENDKTATKAMSFLTPDSAHRGLWFTYLSKFRDAQEYVKDQWTAIKNGGHFTTINGLGEITDVIIVEQPKDYTSADKLNPLQLASLLGIMSIVRKIIDTTNLARYLRQTSIRSLLYSFSLTQPRSKARILKTREGQPLLATAELVAMTPLELAVLEGHKEVVSLLLKRHPRSSMRPDSTFALETAISRCDKEMVRLLIRAGAPKLRASKNADGPVGNAVAVNRLDMIEFLCKSDNNIWARKDSKQDEITYALLHLANDATPSPHDEPRFEDYARLLLRGGASPNGTVSCHEGRSLRHLKYGLLQLLHSRGITLQALGPFPDEQTPLMLVISSMHLSCSGVDPTEIVQFLLDSGASINQTDQKAWSALHHIANQIALGRVKKAWEDMEDDEEHKLYGIAGLLIEAGINQDLEDKENRKAADILEIVGAPVWKRDMAWHKRFMGSEPTSRMSLE
ncbi:hypothetical protein FPOAC2_02265 [Fusarium poae]|uniref:Nephrocystin 3-like N-terminal domain-containing protein n=1 Tax=Fusarium poae TaxID=36050 RepID=A0A1B8B5Y2_FUSPO|nr:hypothetical protein FPOAC1_002176 [Fusarium poae]KAG8676176.1 hypothetical protein FPOAC1_002176 [Fusarium poae]OBS28132.1 hypothetical protein FPOA_02073 [Fusarium poae]